MADAQLFSFVRHYYREPLVIDHASDVYVFNPAGRRFLDGYAGVATVSVGHANPRVVGRVHAQAQLISHTTMLYRTPVFDTYLKNLGRIMPDHLTRHFFVNSGSEAMDFAVQAARAHRRRKLVITLSEGYHGGSQTPGSMTGLELWQPVFGGDPEIHFHPFQLCRQCKNVKWDPDHLRLHPLHAQCPASCLDGLAGFLREKRGDVAAIAIEPVLGVGGILIPFSSFFKRLQELVDEFDLDLICDEVQSGFGRCGTTLFAFQRFGLTPHLLCLAKGIANGFPLGLVSGTEAISEAMRTKLHFSTFGGNPVSCAAADETLNIILDQDLPGQAEANGEFFMNQLAEKLRGNPRVVEIRGLGLMIGIECTDQETAVQVLEGSFARGLLVGLGGRGRNVVRLEPPLSFTRQHVEEAVAILVETFSGFV